MVEFLATCLRNMHTFSYRDAMQQGPKASLKQVVTSTLEGGGVAQDYKAFLLKKVILTSFEVLCASIDVAQEVRYSYAEFKDILVLVEQFNQQFIEEIRFSNTYPWHPPLHTKALHLYTVRRSCQAIELSNLIDVYVKSRVMHLASSLSKKPPSDTLLHLVQFEKDFCMALVVMIGTYTSLFNTTNKGSRFMSVEVSSLHLSPDNITWSDFVIPGEQSETLKASCADIFSRLWSRIAEDLVSSVLVGSWAFEQLVPWLHKASQYTDLEKFPIVASCLKHVSSTCLQQLSLVKWDADFQKCLASDNAKYRKGYKLPMNSSPTPVTLCSNSLQEYMSEQVKETTHVSCHSPDSIASHVNVLRRTLPLCHALSASLSHTTFTLLQNLSSSLSSWNLGSLGWLLFRDIPLARHSLSSSLAVLYGAISPRVSFPVYSGLNSLECSCRAVCSSVHKTSTCLQETLEDCYRHFQSLWECRCSQLLRSSFPKVKRWKTIRNKGEHRIQHSNYCDVLIEQLLLPVTDAAGRLAEGEQKCFLYLTITVFFGEYRKMITSNKKLYSVYAGRQLLADLQYFKSWLTSSNQHLNKAALLVFSELPIAMEIERGLLIICRTAGVDETDSSATHAGLAKGLHQPVLLPSHNFPVFNDIAWNTVKDWEECVV